MDDRLAHKGVTKPPPLKDAGDDEIQAQLASLFHENNLAKVIGVAETLLENNVSKEDVTSIARQLAYNLLQGSSYQISRNCTANGCRERSVPMPRRRILDVRVFPR